MIASENDLINAILHLFKNFEDILIYANRYSDTSIKILKHFGKKCRPSCLKNQKCLYRMWHNETMQVRVKKLFDDQSQRETNFEQLPEATTSEGENNQNLSNPPLRGSVVYGSSQLEGNVEHPFEIIGNDQPQPETNIEHSPHSTTSSAPVTVGDVIQVPTEENEDLQSRIQALETDNKMLQSTITEMAVGNKQLEENVVCNASVPDLEKEIEELTANLASTERRKHELENESVHQGKVITELQVSLNDLRKKIDEATAFVEDLQKQLKQSNLDHVELDSAKQLEIESLQKIISTKGDDIKEMQRLNDDLYLKLEKSSQVGNETDIPIKSNESMTGIDTSDDVIRCVCGLFTDNCQLIQCRKCSVYQHIQCVDTDLNDEYLCELCEERVVNREIALNEFTDKGYRYYLTLMRGDLQVRKSDTVYILRDIPMVTNPEATSPKHTYKTIGKINYTECDIFRVEHLWKDNDGNGLVFGYNYLRPEETYHEPNRKFYKNELIRVPIYEEIPIEMILGRCWVLDPTTYCNGRPIGCDESHLYISDLKTNKARKTFSKVVRQQFPVCKKSFAFTKYVQKIKISRNYTPHLPDTTGQSKIKSDCYSNPHPSKVRRIL